jgi:hypothetical protein
MGKPINFGIHLAEFQTIGMPTFVGKSAIFSSYTFWLFVPIPSYGTLFGIKPIDGQNFVYHILAPKQLLFLPTFWQINLACPYFSLPIIW